MNARIASCFIVLLLFVSGCRSSRPWTIATYNTASNHFGKEAVLHDLQETRADLLCLEEVQERDVAEMAHALGMHFTFAGIIFPPNPDVVKGSRSRGVAIFSKTSLHHAKPFSHPEMGTFGVIAEVGTTHGSFSIASVHLTPTYQANLRHVRESNYGRAKEIEWLRKQWKESGSPPLVIAGDFNQLPIGENYAAMTSECSDAMAKSGKTDFTFHSGLLTSRIDYVLISGDWTVCRADIIETQSSDHRIVRAEIKRR